MTHVIYNKETTYTLRTPARSAGCWVESYKTESAAKAALTRICKKKPEMVREDYDIAEIVDFRNNIEKTETRINLMSKKEFTQPINTPACCDPSTETYWCM